MSYAQSNIDYREAWLRAERELRELEAERDRLREALAAAEERLTRIYEIAGELESALARERGGGSPLPRSQYLALRRRALDARARFDFGEET